MMQPQMEGVVLQDQIKELLQRASRDSLSGLLNRATAEQLIRQRLKNSAVNEQCALFIIDLDDFKSVNDTLGHQAGDLAIRESARILSGLFHANDIISRFGGDEFLIFTSGRLTTEAIEDKGHEICKKLQISLSDSENVVLSASAGICISGTSSDFEILYKCADLELYKAKNSGKGRYSIRTEKSDSGIESHFHHVSSIPLTSLLENLDSGVALIEMDKTIRLIYASPSLCRIIGVDYKTLSLPVSLSRVIHPDDISPFSQALWEGVQNNSPVEHTIRAVTSGRTSWWHIRAVRMEQDASNPVMLATCNDITCYKENESHLEDMNTRLQAALEQTSHQLWEFDIKEKTITVFRQDTDKSGENILYTGFPDNLIESGVIHKKSVEKFRLFASGLLSGQAQGYGSFLIRYKGSTDYGWLSLSYRMLYDDIGHATKAVGLAEPLSDTFSRQSPGSIPQQFLPSALLSNLLIRARMNLTENRIEEVWREGKDLSQKYVNCDCNRILKLIIRDIPQPESHLPDADRLTPDALIRRYHEGERWIAFDSLKADCGGNIRHVRHIIHMLSGNASDEIWLNAYLLQVNIPQEAEKLFPESAFRDSSSMVYERAAIDNIAQRLCGKYAVAIFKANGFTSCEPEMKKRTMTAIAIAVQAALGCECLTGHYQDDGYIILLSAKLTAESLKKEFEEAFTLIRRTADDARLMSQLHFSVGIATPDNPDTQYQTLVRKAEEAILQRRNILIDSISFANQPEDRSMERLQSGSVDDRVSILSMSGTLPPLDEDEKEVVFNCMSIMLSAPNSDASILGVLKTIGLYCSADRVYILSLTRNMDVVTMPYEWDDPCKYMLQQIVSGMKVSSIPIVKRCIAERAPVFLTRNQPESVTGNGITHEPWKFSIFPFLEDNEIHGFLCIENARRNSENTAVFRTIIPYIMNSHRRFQNKESKTDSVNDLMGLPDLRSYMNTIYSLTSDRFSSLGAVCLDIPSMAAINGSLGFEYGGRLLWYVSKTLTDVFGPGLLFRTWEAEFIAFCPDTTKQVFMGRCARMQSILSRRYPKEIRIGTAWADGVFTGRKLADEARSNMGLEKPEEGFQSASLISPLRMPSKTEYDNESQNTVVYYQPVINLNDGSLTGVEALVRGVDSEGTIIPPERFISLLEERGDIRELDFSVLENALDQTDKWRRCGYGLVPISVNLSRVTLQYSSTPASVMAIQSRFPHLPAGLLELEITENAGNIGNKELRQLVDSFRAFGLRVSLDDFGSKYANLSLFASVLFDTVKLDRSLITDLASNQVNMMLVSDLVKICKTRAMRIIAEGIENEEQRKAVLDAGCNYGQGFFYDRPLLPDELEEKYLKAGLFRNKDKN